MKVHDCLRKGLLVTYQLIIHLRLHIRSTFHRPTDFPDPNFYKWYTNSTTGFFYIYIYIYIHGSVHREPNIITAQQDANSYVYWTVHHLTGWINWTNLMSLYESFWLLNVFLMLLHSSSGAYDCMWVYCSVSKQNNTPTYSRQLLRMNIIAFETRWTIKNFHKVTSSWFNLFN